MTPPFRLALPATSANLGPAFDTAAVAWDRWLEVSASPAGEWQLTASGRDAELCSQFEDHLIVHVYEEVLVRSGKPARPLRLHLENQIPIGRGCGSSAAARLAGVALAAHFGNLGWTSQRVFEEAVRSEGHPDNVAACWWGGMVVAQASADGLAVRWLQVPAGMHWDLWVAVPSQMLATSEARRVLPDGYCKADVIANLQALALLLAAWQQGREDVLGSALQDRLHQPYRTALCPLLPALQPTAGRHGIVGCVLSGAGPSVLVLSQPAAAATAEAAMREAMRTAGVEAELLKAQVVPQGPGVSWPEFSSR